MNDARKAKLQALNAARDAKSGSNGAGTPPSDAAVLQTLTDNPSLILNAMTTRTDMLSQLFDPRF